MKLIKSKHFFARVLIDYFKSGINFRAVLNYGLYKALIVRDRYLSGSYELKYSPVSTTVWLTSRCNMSCSFCHYSDELYPPSNKEHNLDFEKFKKIYGEYPWINRSLRFSLYGGEPLLNQDWSNFVVFLKKQGHLVSINTNGILLEKNLELILSTRPNFISVSYYPENIKKLEKVLPQISLKIPIRLSYMASPENADHLDSFFKHAKEWGVSMVAVDNYVPNGSLVLKKFEEDDQASIAMKSVVRKYREKYSDSFSIDWNLKKIDTNKTECRFFWNSTFINEDGKVNPCSVWRRTTFVDLEDHWWNGKSMKFLRKSMKENKLPIACQNCDCAYTDISGV